MISLKVIEVNYHLSAAITLHLWVLSITLLLQHRT